MKRSRLLLALGVSVFLMVGCRTMYQLELVSDATQNRSVYTQYPNYVNMLVRVTDGRVTTRDQNGNAIPDFSDPDYYVVGLESRGDGDARGNFSVVENGVEVKVEAGLRVVPLDELSLHINVLMDVSGSIGEVGLIQAKNAVKRLIARPCTPAEAGGADCFTYRYTDWDAKTESFVERNESWRSNLRENQIVTIYAFSDTVRRVRLREVDSSGRRYPDKTRQLLDTIDRNITLGVDSTNLYGAMLAALDDLRAVRTLTDPKRGFVDGIVVAFTDGSHTAGNIQHAGRTYTPKQAIAQIHQIRGELTDLNSLRIITLAVRSPELQETIREGDLAGGGLRDLQNAGYLRVNNYGALEARFVEAFELIERYTRSLYWIYYRSPKSGFQTVDIDLRVTCRTCEKGPGGSIPDFARIRESVQTNGFYQMLPGVYINDPILDNQGNIAQRLDSDGVNIALFGPDSIELRTSPDTTITSDSIYSLIVANNPDRAVVNPSNTAILRLHTYVRANDNRFKPQYRITSSDESVVSVIGAASLTVIESVVLIEARRSGTARIDVVDIANGNLRDSITVRSLVN